MEKPSAIKLTEQDQAKKAAINANGEDYNVACVCDGERVRNC